MNQIELTNGMWRLVLSEDGHPLSLTDGQTELVRKDVSPRICELLLTQSGENRRVTSATLVRHDQKSAAYACEVNLGTTAHLQFEWELLEPDKTGTPIRCTVNIVSPGNLGSDVLLKWLWNFLLPVPDRKLFVPLFDGHGLRTSLKEPRGWHYECTGLQAFGSEKKLAMPIVDEYSFASALRITHFADPFFGTSVILPFQDSPGAFSSKFLSVAGSQQFQKRLFGFYLHLGDADAALQAYFDYAISNCSPGPRWLHDIAMVDYDFLSKKGQGWFRDIDKLTELIAPVDRHRVLLTLHGWYDLLGHYSYDESTEKLLAEWITMPGSDKITMTPDDMHKRIAYAKERGFRVALYFADGMAIDSGAPNYSEDTIYREPDGQLRKHHWGGPDTIAQTYIMNPLHPRARSFFHGYMKAMLDEFGREIDVLDWDETFTIRVGDVSTGKYPGYADRGFMLLCKELRERVKAKNPEIALLASDCTGLMLPQDEGSYWHALPAQNALVFDGTFQDSHFNPTAWQYGLFPNYRNVLWSCNWQPFNHFDWTNTGVRVFGAPVPISNGWGEDKGISDCSEAEVKKIMELFEFKKNQRSRLRWLDASDEF